MKLEKREITLNERDSLQDTLYMQKTLLNAYGYALDCAAKKATRVALLDGLRVVGEDVFFIQDLLQNTNEEME